MDLKVSSGSTPILTGTTNLPDGYVLAIYLNVLGENNNSIEYIPVRNGQFSIQFGNNHEKDDGSAGLYPGSYYLSISQGNGVIPASGLSGPLTAPIGDLRGVSVVKTLVISDRGNRLAAPDSDNLAAAKVDMSDLDVVRGQATAAFVCRIRSPEWYNSMELAYQKIMWDYRRSHTLNAKDARALEDYDLTLTKRTTGNLAGYHYQKCDQLSSNPILAKLDQIQYNVVGSYH
jgi:hypothetical protein